MLRLVFTTGDDWFSQGVRALSLSEVAHVAIGFGVGLESNHLLHARLKKGIALEPRKKWRQRTIAEFAVLKNVSPGLSFCLSCIGQPYDAAEVAERPLLSLIRSIMPLAPQDNRKPGAWNCARFVLCLDPTGQILSEWRDLDPLTATPADVYEATLNGPSFRLLSHVR